ncbi:MAG: DUF2461 domain-containing protein [Ferruginibacter sp.]
MLQTSTLKFLKDLEKNNNKLWFEQHRKLYEAAKTDHMIFVETLIKKIAVFDKPIGDQLAKNCIFRINRDVRFSKNKSPYKNNMGAYFNKAGKKGLGAGYYFHLQPGKSFAAAGIWMPEPAVLGKIRQEIDYNLDEWKKIINNSAFKKNFPAGLESGESLSRPPKGYDISNPAIKYIKMKSFVVTHSFPDAAVISKGAVNDIANAFKATKSLVDFFNRAID